VPGAGIEPTRPGGHGILSATSRAKIGRNYQFLLSAWCSRVYANRLSPLQDRRANFQPSETHAEQLNGAAEGGPPPFAAGASCAD
jgi:hypothetical protein